MNATSLKAWFAQPSSILGLGALLGTVSGIVAQVLTHNTTVTAGIGLVVFAVVHMLLPDNSAAPSSIEKLTTDTLTAILQKRLAASIPALFADAIAVEQAIVQPAAVVTTTVATPAAPLTVVPNAGPVT